MTYKKILYKIPRTILIFVVAVIGVWTFGNVALAQTATSTMSTTTGTTATTTTYQVMVMNHLCGQNIKNLTDFQNLTSNRDSLGGFANQVFNCPTTGLSGNNPALGSIAAPRTAYNFQVMENMGTTTQTLSANGVFMPEKLCESDINKDINLDGTVAISTCFDISHYRIPITASSTLLNVTENSLPSGYHFGTVLFTPVALMSNNDAQDLLSVNTGSGMIRLDMASDTDKTVMLHVFNFANATNTSTSTPNTGTTTPPDLSNVDKQTLLNLISSLQRQIDMIMAQLHQLQQQIMNNNNNGSGNEGGTSTTTPTTTPVQSSALIRAAATTVVIGDDTDFAGEKFGANESVVMSNDGQNMMTFQTDKEGNFNTGSIFVPRTPGTKTYVFTGQTSGIVRSVDIRITPIP